MTVCNFLTFEKIARLITAASPTEQANPVVPAPIQADQQESSDEPEEDSDQAENDEPPATEIVAERAWSPLQPRKRRYIEIQRREPKTGGAETQKLQTRQNGEDKPLLYIRNN
jgi:hypothetical protein